MPQSPRESAGRPTSTKVEAGEHPTVGARAKPRRGLVEDQAGGVNRAGSAASEDAHAVRSDDPTDVPASSGELESARADGADADGVGADGAGTDGAGTDDLVLGELVPDDARALHHGNEDRAIDAELVRRAQGGDHAAFRQLFDRYHRRVYAVAFGVLKNRHDALDCVQEGFVKVHRHLPNFQGTSSFYTWLYRIVMNLAIDQLRRRKTAKPVEFDDARRRDGEEPGDDAIVSRLLDENPRKAVIRRELLERVQAALAELPEYHRQVILLREIEGLSYEEMAEALDVPKGTIMSRLFHARKKMQEALKGYVDGDLEIEE